MRNEFTKTGYSKDFNFFLNHQILISESKGDTIYLSRIEKRTFLTDKRGKAPSFILEECRKIHSNLVK